MFKATVGTKEDGELVKSEPAATAKTAIAKAASAVANRIGDTQRVRIGVFESNAAGEFNEIFFVWGDGIVATTKAAYKMDRKSRAGNGR